MTGIVFFGTNRREDVVAFYTQQIGASVWVEQPDCTILNYDGFLFGFCSRPDADVNGILTFLKDSKSGVDAAYEDLTSWARASPTENDRYQIYHFYADDPEGRDVEIQTFLHETDPVR